MEPSAQERGKMAGELCEKGLWREVLAFAQKWLEANPGSARAYYYLGAGLSGLRRYSQASAAYRQALQLDPTDFDVWNALAELLYRNLRRQMDGIQCLEQGLKMNPHHKLGWLSLARLNGRMGRHDKALQCADHALALDPKLVEAHLSRGAAARALGKTDIIREVCCKLATIEPEYFQRAH